MNYLIIVSLFVFSNIHAMQSCEEYSPVTLGSLRRSHKFNLGHASSESEESEKNSGEKFKQRCNRIDKQIKDNKTESTTESSVESQDSAPPCVIELFKIGPSNSSDMLIGNGRVSGSSSFSSENLNQETNEKLVLLKKNIEKNKQKHRS